MRSKPCRASDCAQSTIEAIMVEGRKGDRAGKLRVMLRLSDIEGRPHQDARLVARRGVR